jgi:hypothetical protein
MTRFRFSLLGLGGMVAAAAMCCWALINASAWVASAALTLVGLVMSLSVVTALLAPRSARGLSTGFAVCGWLYLLMVFGPLERRVGDSMLTTSLLEWAAQQMPGAMTDAVAPPGGFVFAPRVPNTDYLAAFADIGQAIFTVVFALAGGLLGQFVMRRTSQEAASPARDE